MRKRRYARSGSGRCGDSRHQPAGASTATWRTAVGQSDGWARSATAALATDVRFTRRSGLLLLELAPGAPRRPRLLREAQHHLADDVALHLRGARVDRAGPGDEEGPDPRRAVVRR